jgi:hypothetical protein
MASAPPQAPRHDARARVVAPARLVGDLGVALAHTVAELPHLVHDLRGLVRRLERSAQPDGELMRLLDALAELARARAEHERARADAARVDAAQGDAARADVARAGVRPPSRAAA